MGKWSIDLPWNSYRGALKPSFTIWGTGFGIAITEKTVARTTDSRRLYFTAKSDRQWPKTMITRIKFQDVLNDLLVLSTIMIGPKGFIHSLFSL
jgi:hypothetical protein